MKKKIEYSRINDMIRSLKKYYSDSIDENDYKERIKNVQILY